MSSYHPRYLAYCAAHGKTTAQMLAQDRAKHPGSSMAGFITWIEAKWAEWERATGSPPRFRSTATHRKFDRWLSEQCGVTTA